MTPVRPVQWAFGITSSDGNTKSLSVGAFAGFVGWSIVNGRYSSFCLKTRFVGQKDKSANNSAVTNHMILTFRI